MHFFICSLWRNKQINQKDWNKNSFEQIWQTFIKTIAISTRTTQMNKQNQTTEDTLDYARIRPGAFVNKQSSLFFCFSHQMWTRGWDCEWRMARTHRLLCEGWIHVPPGWPLYPEHMAYLLFMSFRVVLENYSCN